MKQQTGKAGRKVTVRLTLEQLESLQYAGVKSWGYEESGCPACPAHEDAEHDPNCWIGKALSKLKQKAVRP